MYDLLLLVLNHGFEFQDSVCNGCHDLRMLSVNIRDTVIITVKNVDYRCIIHNISKSEVIYLLKNLYALRSWVCIKKLKKENIVLNFSLPKVVFFIYLFFCFFIYKMVDSEYSIGNNKFVKISIEIVMRNPEILKFVAV